MQGWETAPRVFPGIADNRDIESSPALPRPEREIIDAVANSGKVARGVLRPSDLSRWASVDYITVHKTVVGCPFVSRTSEPFHQRTLEPKDLRTEGPRGLLHEAFSYKGSLVKIY
jgi:hypothetical protein